MVNDLDDFLDKAKYVFEKEPQLFGSEEDYEIARKRALKTFYLQPETFRNESIVILVQRAYESILETEQAANNAPLEASIFDLNELRNEFRDRCYEEKAKLERKSGKNRKNKNRR